MRQAFQFGCWKLASLNRGVSTPPALLQLVLHPLPHRGHLAPLPTMAGQINGKIHSSRMTGGRHQRPPACLAATWSSARVMGRLGHHCLLFPSAGWACWLGPGQGMSWLCPAQQPTWGEGQRSSPSEHFASSDERIWSGFNEATLIPHLFTHVSRPNVWIVLDVMLWFCFQSRDAEEAS